jgi:cytosine/adenosine deaminase-related metal-dependent hydrolase
MRIHHRLLFAAALVAPAGALTAERLLVRDATFITIAPAGPSSFTGYLLVDDDGTITDIAPGRPPATVQADTVLEASGKIVVPGFISAHSHVWQSALRGLGADQYVRGWGQAVRVYSTHATDEDLYWFTLHGALDHLQHGITAVYDFGYAHRAGGYNDEQFRGLVDSGIRHAYSFAQARTEAREQRYAEFLEFMKFARPHFDDPRFLRLAISGTADDEEEVRFDKRLMDEFGVLNQTHYLEWPLEKARQQENFARFVEVGTLGPNQYFGHFIHTTDDMLRATAAAGSGMSWNPLSNGRLASGIADIPKYLELGVAVGMGVDGQASADLADPLENMRVGLYLVRASYESSEIMQPIDVLRLHTLGSARVMGIADKVGSLEVGKLADFVVISPSGEIDRAPVFDPAAAVVFASNPANIEAVYVGGDRVVDRGVFVHADMKKVSAEVEQRVRRLQQVAGR